MKNTMIKRFIACFILCITTMLCGCAPEKEHTQSFFAMNTYMSVTAYGDNAQPAVQQVQSTVTQLDSLWSVTDENSELYALNSNGSGTVSSETAELIRFCLNISEKTNGAFEPTIYPVLTSWGFTTDENRVPSDEEISNQLEKVGCENVLLFDKNSDNGSEVTLSNGAMLDFGGIAKGAAADKAAEIMRENGVTSALINLGGSITVIGKNSDNSNWRIGVKDPFSDGNIGILEISDTSAVTSGAYERCFTASDGTVYGHIIDPASGRPVDNDLASVTIISENATLCDALSTALFVMGKEKALQFADANSKAMGFDYILITKDKEMFISGGAAANFTLTDKNGIQSIIV